MVPFSYSRATDAQAAAGKARSAASSHVGAPVQFMGGGTTLLDLMKLSVMQPDALIDITPLERRYAGITTSHDGLRIGALARMTDVAESPVILKNYPVLSQSLLLAASQQLRNMARVGGNALQRTRCTYFCDTTYDQCNKRNPGSGCAAMDGYNREHAVLGTSDDCIATYPGDWAQALIALDANVELMGQNGPRTVPFADLHRVPGNTPHIETNLAPGELITAFVIPGPPSPRSVYTKIRDRDSYQFGLATAAVALRLQGDTVTQVRIAIGGVATKPWRAAAAEQFLQGKTLDEAAATQAGKIAFAGARPREHNAYKVPLGQATVTRALLQAKQLDVQV